MSGTAYYYTAFAFSDNGSCEALGRSVVNLAPGGVSGVDPRGSTCEFAVTVFPNPTGRHVAVRYDLALDGPVELAVYNAEGQAVRTLVEGFSTRGSHETTWDRCDQNGMRVAPGIYFVTLKSGSDVRTAKLTVAR